LKKLTPIVLLLLFVASFNSTFGQTTTPATPGAPAGAGTPAGGGDRNLSDSLRKMNSIELERVKRESQRPTEANSAIHSKAQSKFSQIKEDFEGIQIAESAIIKTYTTDKKIDYALIEISAGDIIKRAKRLDSNMFAEPLASKDETAESEHKDEKEKTEKPKSLKELIVDLNNAIGSFVSSPIFGNLKVVDPKVAVKAREDLVMIEEISEKISAEAKKLK
jgi:hypothetical protein